MKRPKTVRILGRVFKVTYVIKGSLADDELGEVDLGKQRIAILEGMAADKERAVLLHEIVHGIDDILDLRMSEKQVEGIENGLFAVLSDNPRLPSYLRRK